MPSTRRYHYSSDHGIVIFQPQFVEFGGEERVILSLSRELQSQGKPHSVLCYWDDINLAAHASWPLRVHQLYPRNNPLAKVLALRRCLADIARAGGPTPVLFNIQSAYHAGLAASAPYHLRIPDTYSLLGFPAIDTPPPTPTLLQKIRAAVAARVNHAATRRGIVRARKLVTNTRALQTEMARLYGRNAEVIYLGGFGQPSENRLARAAAPLELLTVSRLQGSKRIDWILQALAQASRDGQHYPDWRLHIAGSGPDRAALEALTHSLGLDARVQFHGFVTDAQLDELYSRAHLFLMPAKQGYGLPAIEALYKKMGLVVSEESGVAEILEGSNWVSIARNGKAGFARAMQDMLLRAAQPEFFDQPLPPLPTEAGWAREIIGYLGW